MNRDTTNKYFKKVSAMHRGHPIMMTVLFFMHLFMNSAVAQVDSAAEGRLVFEKALLVTDTMVEVPEGEIWQLREAFERSSIIVPDNVTKEGAKATQRNAQIERDSIRLQTNTDLSIRLQDLPVWVGGSTYLHFHPDDIYEIKIEKYRKK
jgi:hypothetical protein